MLDADLQRRLDGDWPDAETWKPEPGDVLTGYVTDLGEIEGQYGSYPVVVVGNFGGRPIAWYAQPTVARYELSRVAPQIGDRIAIRYDGKPEGRNYHSFKVAGEPGRIDWSRYRRLAKS